jgi:replicative DNA helicase
MDKKYIHIKQTLNSKGILVPYEESETVFKNIKSIFGKDAEDLDCYRSLFYYTQEGKDYFDSNNDSVAGFKGKVYSNTLFFDLDSEDVNKAKEDTKELLHRLQQLGVSVENEVRVFFSGKKGFHVEVPTEKNYEPEELKTICSNIAEGLESFDPVVYNATRVIRILNTRHQSSNLYKIELEPYDIIELSVEQIKEKAKQRSKPFTAKSVKNCSIFDKYLTSKPKFKQAVVDDSNSIDGIRGLDEVDFNACPKNKPRCIHALEHGVMVPGRGERSAIYLRLAAYYRNQGLPKESAYGLLKGIARQNARLYPEAEPFSKDELWLTVITSAYSKNWKQVPGAVGTDETNSILKRYCDAAGKFTNQACSLHSKKETSKTLVQISDVFDDFSVFATNYNNNVVPTGIKFFDDNVKITTGTTNLLVGSAGCGKTTLSLNILQNANSNNLTSVFFSMDMNRHLVMLKLATKHTGYSQKQILNFYEEKNTKKIEEIKHLLKSNYNKTHFDFSTSLTLDIMREKIFEIEQRTGEKVKFVLVDYAGRISGPFSDVHANANYNALRTVEIADTTDTAMIILSQIARQTGDGATPIRTKRAAKDSGTWEESATNVITMWRPFLGDQERDDVVRFFLAKNRMGKELEQILHWDGERCSIKDMSENELIDYNSVRGDKAEREYLRARSGKVINPFG